MSHLSRRVLLNSKYTIEHGILLLIAALADALDFLNYMYYGISAASLICK